MCFAVNRCTYCFSENFSWHEAAFGVNKGKLDNREQKLQHFSLPDSLLTVERFASLDF